LAGASCWACEIGAVTALGLQLPGPAQASLAPSVPAEIAGEALAPAITNAGGEWSSAGTLTTSTIPKEAGAEFAVNTPRGEVRLTPLGTSPHAGAPLVVHGAAVLFGEPWPASDAVVRPEPLGASALVDVHSARAPRSFSWEVGLGPGEWLQQLPDGNVAAEARRPAWSWQSFPPPATLERPTAPYGTAAVPTTAGLGVADARGDYEAGVAALAYAEAQSDARMLLVVHAEVLAGVGEQPMSAALGASGRTLTLSVDPGSLRRLSPNAFPITVALHVWAPSDIVSAEQREPEYGLADDRPSVLAGAAVGGRGLVQSLADGPLHLHVARLIVPYDVALTGGPELARLHEWLRVVGETVNSGVEHLEPYVTLWSLACLEGPPKPCTPPPLARYRQAVRALFEEYGAHGASPEAMQVGVWGAWNEPDLRGAGEFPPEAAAGLWQAATEVARDVRCDCELVAGELSGLNPEYDAAYKRVMVAHHLRPAVWGLHDYEDLVHVPDHASRSATPERNPVLSRFIELTETGLGKPRVWLSEQGVELKNNSGFTRLFGNDPLQHLAAEDFLRLGEESGRVALVDYYMSAAPEAIAGHPNPEREAALVFDSALVGELGQPRAAYCVLAYESHRCGSQPPGQPQSLAESK
jgi:hypothetical protein